MYLHIIFAIIRSTPHIGCALWFDCPLRFHLTLTKEIFIARYIPNPVSIQRIVAATTLCSSKYIIAKTSVTPAYENTIIGKYFVTFSAISISCTVSFTRSEVELTIVIYYHNYNG